MARVIEQNLTVQPIDADGIMVEATDITGPFPIALPIDGAFSSTNPYDGASEVNFVGAFWPTITFSTGLTGSAAVVTVIGRDQNGNPQTELVTMPGASSTVTTTGYWSFVESMTIDGAYTNLSVGVIGASGQVGRWVLLDHYQNGFEVMGDLIDVVTGWTVTIDMTTDNKFIRSGNPEPDSSWAAEAPFAAATTAVHDVLAKTPVVAARARLTAGSAGNVIMRLLQSGGGYR
jgi:hypothetical protein